MVRAETNARSVQLAIELIQPFSPAAPSGGDDVWRPSPAALLADASRYHLSEATTDAQGAAEHLEALARHRGLSREQAHRLRSAAAAAGMAVAVAERMLWELRAG